MPDQLIDYAYEWACKYGLGTEARTAIKAVLDEKDAEVERLEAKVKEQEIYLEDSVSRKFLEDYGNERAAEGMEAAAKIARDKAEQLDVGSNCEIEAQQWLLYGLADDISAAAKETT